MAGAMGRKNGRGERAGNWLGASVLVFILLLLHLALMTTEHHDAGEHEGHGALAQPIAALASLAAAPHGEHDAPRSTLDGCPVGVAILPLLALLLLIAAFAGHAPRAELRAGIALPRRSTLPPPLAAPQRRALLQVFLI